MELGMFTCGYQFYPLERAFADARRFGYDYIELWGGRPHAFAPDLARGGADEVCSLMDRYEMPVAVYTPEHNAYPYNYMLGSETQRREALDYLKLAMDMGKALGAAYTLVSVGHGGYGIPRSALWKRMADSLTELARHGEEIGHAVVVETLSHYESGLCTTAGELAQVLGGSPWPTTWTCWESGWSTSTWWTATGPATATWSPATGASPWPSCWGSWRRTATGAGAPSSW